VLAKLCLLRNSWNDPSKQRTLPHMSHRSNLEGGSLALLVMVAVSCSASSADLPQGGGLDAGVPFCGNGLLERGEACEGTAPIAATCAAVTMGAKPIGSVRCVACRIDQSGCQSAAGAGGTPVGPVGMGGGIGTAGSGNANGGSGFTGSGGTVGSGGTLGNGGTIGSGGTLGSGGTIGSGGTGGSGGTVANGGASTGGGGGSGPLGDVNALRQACIDTINMYRATMSGVAPLTRATASVETCSDTGAQSDATAGVAHGSAGKCPGMGAQDTCPGWDPARYGGAEGALKACLQSMWAEGAPPEGRTQCIQEYFQGNTACFLKYGHYLNMSDPANGVASCGFYVMPGGKLWMNQDFGH
jgi:hypothetical protein